jgi:hypothetical protein
MSRERHISKIKIKRTKVIKRLMARVQRRGVIQTTRSLYALLRIDLERAVASFGLGTLITVGAPPIEIAGETLPDDTVGTQCASAVKKIRKIKKENIQKVRNIPSWSPRRSLASAGAPKKEGGRANRLDEWPEAQGAAQQLLW